MFFHIKIKNIIEFDIVLNKLKTLCFTGHRSQKLPWRFNENDERCITMKKELKEQLEISINEGYDTFLSGMALGFDMICVETLLELKKKYKHIIIIGVLPCKDQDCKWPEKEQKRYRKLLDQLDYIRCKYDKYIGAECMLERNRFMVDNSSKMIALFNGQNGGTKSTIDYAKKRGLDIEIINLCFK
jgi:uncharacterized phage-like protein YoqJ